MAPLRLRFLCLLTLAFLLCPLVRATDFPPISDEDIKFKEVPGQPGAPAAILFHEEIDDDAKNHDHMTYERIKILTEAGRRYATVVLPFYRNYSDITNVSGRTIHADGTIVPFDGTVLDKIIFNERGRKLKTKSFTLPDVQVGSIIEYRYYFRYSDERLFAPRWVLQNELWQKKIHYKFIFYPINPPFHEVIIQHGLTANGVSWSANVPKELQPKEPTALPGRDAFYEVNGSDIKAFISEPFMPDSDQFKYYIHFYYATARNQDEFWKQEGKFWSKDVEHFLSKNNGVAQQVSQLVSPSDTPEQKVKKIYDFVAHLDNDSFMPRRTEQEIKLLGIKDRGASDILQQKSGDRFDITRLFVAMVRAAGIPARMMEVTSREDNFFEPTLLSADQLDAELAIVQINGKDVFLDPGSKYCPYGMLDWRLTATKGLEETDHGTAIADTPSPAYNDAVVERIGRFVMNDDGSVEGNIRVVYIGQGAITHRQTAMKTDDAGRKKDLEDEVRAWLPSGADVKLTVEPVWDGYTKDFSAQFHVQTSMAANAGKRVLLPGLVFQVNDKPRFPSNERVNGVYLYYPSREIDEVSITIPQSMDIENLPQNENVRRDYALYITEWSRQARTVTVKRDVAMGGFVFPVTEYKELKGFYDKVKAGDDQQAVLKVSSNVVGK